MWAHAAWFTGGTFVGVFVTFLFSCGKRGDDGIKALAQKDAPKKLVWLYRSK